MYFHKNWRLLLHDGQTWIFNSPNTCAFLSDVSSRKTKPAATEFGATIFPSEVGIEGPSRIERRTGSVQKKDSYLKPTRADPYEEIPGPKVFRPFSDFVKNAARGVTVGALLRLLRRDSLGLFRKYGPVVRLPEFLGGKILVVYKPEHVATILEKVASKSTGVSGSLDSVERCRSLKGRNRPEHGRSYLVGEEWETVKNSVAIPPVKDEARRYRNIQSFAVDFAEKIRFSRNKRNETPENFFLEVNKWSLECLCFVLSGKTWGFLDAEKMARSSKPARLLTSFVRVTERVRECESGLQLWRFVDSPELESLRKECEALDKILSENVRQAQLSLTKRKERPSDVVGDFPVLEELLLRPDLEPEDVSAAAFDFLLIGANATSSAFAFFLYHVARNPRVQDRLFSEIRRVLPRSDGTLSRDGLASLKYLDACLNESLRLKMPRPVVAKVLSEDVVLSDYRVPRGTCVVAAAQIEGLKEENFQDAEEYRPERWSDEDFRGPPVYFPLSGGLVGGLQARTAEDALRLCIVHVFRRFRIEYNYEKLNATHSVISIPDKPLRFTVTERE